MRKFFYREWWSYVLDDSRADSDYGPFDPYLWIDVPWSDDYPRNPIARLANYLSRCWCRAQGHPCGVAWYSQGLEPDMTCKGCGEDLG
jgi:hypothetical protein